MSPIKPSDQEEEYFLRQEAEKLKALAEKTKQETAEAERGKLKELHWMRCPKCGMELTEINYRGVAIDKCYSCGGVYLDDGELEQIAAVEDEGGVFSGLSRIFRGKD